MIKLLGAALIVTASAAAGFGFARAICVQLRQMDALLGALEIMKSEMEYRLTPLGALCAALSYGDEPETAAFFGACAAQMEADRCLPPQLAIQRAMEQAQGLKWSARTRETVRNLAFSLGKFDLGGQVRAIELAQERLRAELAEVQAGSRARCRSYETIGICAGLALAVVLI